MTFTLATDENNDLFVGQDAALATRSGLLAVLQTCEHAAKTQLAEMIYAVEDGIPNFTIAWNGAPNLAQYEAYMRRALLAVVDVLEISEFVIVAAGDVLSYRATIQTTYGVGVLNG